MTSAPEERVGWTPEQRADCLIDKRVINDADYAMACAFFREAEEAAYARAVAHGTPVMRKAYDQGLLDGLVAALKVVESLVKVRQAHTIIPSLRYTIQEAKKRAEGAEHAKAKLQGEAPRG